MSSPARQPFHMMAKPTGFQCNIACDYCFYLKKGTGTLKPDAPSRRMDNATLESYISRYIGANPAHEVEFTWQGGEPTMAGLEFFARIVKLQSKYAGGKVIRNSIQTNGLLIDAKWADFLARHQFLVGLSIDGPAALHDAHRVSRNGKGVHDRVIRALNCLKAAGVEYNILAVVNSTTAQHPKTVYNYLTKDLGAEFLQFIPAVEQSLEEGEEYELAHPQHQDRLARVTPWSVSGEDFGHFMAGIFDEWIKADVGRVYVQLFDNALAAWAGIGASLCVMQPTCGNALVVEKNGDVYSCDHYVYPEHRLGNLTEDDLGSMVDSPAQRAFGRAKADLPESCLGCEWRFTCHGGCPKHRIHHVQNHWHNHLCMGYKIIFSHMAPYMRFMTEQLKQGRPPADVMKMRREIVAGGLSE